jgi:hypothetical protein
MMENITEIKIIGTDENRPALLSAAPYIELVFKLSQQAPQEWCKDFNLMFEKYKYSARIDFNKGLFIETWVRKMEEIAPHFELLKTKIIACNEISLQKQAALDLKLLGNKQDVSAAQGEQLRLNEVIAGLSYD